MYTLILGNAAMLRSLYENINEAFRAAPHGPAHTAACASFHEQYDSLAFPGGLQIALAKLKERDPDTIELAIQFLETDARFHRSGYIMEEVLRRLKHCELKTGQQRRLRMLITRSIQSGGRRASEGYSRLAAFIYTPTLVQEMEERLSSADAEIRRRASAVLHAIRSKTNATSR